MKIQTVLGPISPEELGITYCHMHIYFKVPTDDLGNVLPDIDKNVEEMVNFKETGGNSVVDGNIWTERARQLVEISKRSKVNIIATSGIPWLEPFPEDRALIQKWNPPPPIINMSIDDLADEVIKTVKMGLEDTGIKAGVIKTGAPYNCITPRTEHALKAIARAQIETDAPVFLHTTKGTMGVEQCEVLKKEGADLSKVGVGHVDRNPDLYYYRQLVKMGANLIFDCISKVKYWPDSVHVKNIRKLADEGYERQILFGMDFGHYRDLKAYGGGPGYTWVLEKFIPRLKNEGFKEESIEKFMINNPKRYLAF